MTQYLNAAEPPHSANGIDYYGLSLDDPGGAGSTVEPDLWRTCRTHLDPHLKVLMGGGGLGTLSALLAWRHGNDQVWTVEPNQELVRFMRHNIRVRKQPLNIEEGALWDRDGRADLSLGDWWGLSSLVEEQGRDTMTVETLDVNRLIRRHQITALVLDIEGAEDRVLLSCEYSPIRAVIVECHATTDVRALCRHLVAIFKRITVDQNHGPPGLTLVATR